MELNKYQINRIKANVIEDIAATLTRNLESARTSQAEEKQKLQEMAAEHEPDSWYFIDQQETVKKDEIRVATWSALLDTLDKMLCK